MVSAERENVQGRHGQSRVLCCFESRRAMSTHGHVEQ